MQSLEGRTAIITGAGRGIGAEHAKLLASLGAKVVVNDLGADVDGGGGSAITSAQAVVDEIRDLGGDAIVNGDNVADWDGAERMVRQAIETFGTVDVLVNNAGILRDRMLVNMTEDDWDAVMNVHLKGHFAPMKHCFSYWRAQTKAGAPVAASVVNTSSVSGLLGNIGQANYASAKAGIANLTIIGAIEGGRYGIRVNGIAPIARTRLTLATPGNDHLKELPPADTFDPFDPANVSPLVALLASAECDVTGAMFHIGGSQVGLYRNWELTGTVEIDGRWSVEGLDAAVATLTGSQPMASVPMDMVAFNAACGDGFTGSGAR